MHQLLTWESDWDVGQTVSSVALLVYELGPSLVQADEVTLHQSLCYQTQVLEYLLAGTENLPREHWLAATAANMSLQKPDFWERQRSDT